LLKPGGDGGHCAALLVVAEGLERTIDEFQDCKQWDLICCFIQEVASSRTALAAQQAAFLEREKNLLEKLDRDQFRSRQVTDLHGAGSRVPGNGKHCAHGVLCLLRDFHPVLKLYLSDREFRFKEYVDLNISADGVIMEYPYKKGGALVSTDNVKLGSHVEDDLQAS